MDWLDRMNRAVDYIEENLDSGIDLDRAAQLACCSSYHFQRMFTFITSVSLSEYIRRRRMTLAAFELQDRNAKIIDVSMKYGYESPASFSRAFKKLHGVQPTAAREAGAGLKAYPRMSFQITIQGSTEMDYRIEEKGAFELFGASGKIDAPDQETAFLEVPKFRLQCDLDGTVDRMNSFLGRLHDTCLHAALFGFTPETFRYMICGEVPEGAAVPVEFERLSIPALTWAIFPARDCDVPAVWRRVYTEWFPTSDYEQAAAPQLERYAGRAGVESGEVWIPVQKRG